MAAKLLSVSGGASPDGTSILFGGRTDQGQIMLSIDTDKVDFVIGRLAISALEAAAIAGWTPKPIAQRDDTGVWMTPTRYGLIAGDTPDSVHLAMDVGPIRFRFALTKSDARSLGQTLITDTARTDNPN